jgi:hypothetical protein
MLVAMFNSAGTKVTAWGDKAKHQAASLDGGGAISQETNVRVHVGNYAPVTFSLTSKEENERKER